jgi:co-chaperonin GroES (HSP10)
MRERIMQRKNIAFIAGKFMGKDTSGFGPVGDLVTILLDVVSGKLGTKGLLDMSQQTIEAQNNGVTSGIVVALGDDAFSWNSDRTRPFGGGKPKVGDRVMFVRYAGEFTLGEDEKAYRVMSDNSIIAVFKEQSNGQ